MRQRFNILLAGGQGELKGKIFRIGHLGFVADRDILSAIAALECTLEILGHQDWTPGTGVRAAAEILASP